MQPTEISTSPSVARALLCSGAMTPRLSLSVLVFLCLLLGGGSASAAEVCQAQLRDIRSARVSLRGLQRSQRRLHATQRRIDHGKLRGRADVTRLQIIARMLPPITSQIRALITEIDVRERAYIRCVERSLESPVGPGSHHQ